MEEAGKTLSRVREEKKKEEDGKGRAQRGERTRSGVWRRDRGGWTEGWLAVSE